MSKHTLFWIVPLFLLVATVIFSPFLDMPIERYYFDYQGKHFIDSALTDLIYDWGVLPAQVVGVLALVALLLSYLRQNWIKWRKPALVLVLTMAIGAGFITHTLLKDNWGRPRPKQVIEFGGEQAYRSIYQPNFFHQPEPSKSFPCGHCTMGFFFFSLYFVGKRLRIPLVSYGSLFIAITLGLALSFTRMAQGGHFFSDTLVAAIIMWLTALTCDWLVYGDEN